jgi:GTP-binding protein HflX
VHYVGKGKLEEIKERVALDAIDIVVADDELAPRVQTTLEEALGRRVIDRTAVILDIFARRARTHEGRIQVELAQYEFLLPRLRGWGTELSRLGGGIGTRGPGETRLEVDRRRVRQRIGALQREIEHIRRHRQLLRRGRDRRGLPLIALVGYTNVGKTTLLRALTGDRSAAVVDAPFVTLDPLTRGMRLPGGGEALVSDTVGFISKLPHALIAAFRATLEELHGADVLVHVIDITHPCPERLAATVDATLKELGLEGKPVIVALNKADALPGGEVVETRAGARFDGRSGHALDRVVVSALTGEGLDTLRACVDRRIGELRADGSVSSAKRRGGALRQGAVGRRIATKGE